MTFPIFGFDARIYYTGVRTPAHFSGLDIMAISNSLFLLCSSDSFIKDSQINLNVLFFRKEFDSFIVVTDLESPIDIAVIGERTERLTGFRWDREIIRGYQHNLRVEATDERLHDLLVHEMIANMPTA